jgi:hypothetical protein
MAAERRLAILQLMIEDAGQANERTLFIALRQMGLGVALEQAGVRALIVDLEARMCLTTTLYDDTLLVAKITDRGRLVVAGDLTIDGIAPPSAVL